MKTFKALIHFTNEAEPRIRSGRRIVLVKVGRRWIRITECATGRSVRLPMVMRVGDRTMNTLDALHPQPI